MGVENQPHLPCHSESQATRHMLGQPKQDQPTPGQSQQEILHGSDSSPPPQSPEERQSYQDRWVQIFDAMIQLDMEDAGAPDDIANEAWLENLEYDRWAQSDEFKDIT